MSARGVMKTKTYNKARAEVFKAITEALTDLRIPVIEMDEARGIITAASGFSIFSTGTHLEINLEPANEAGEVAVTITARPKLKTVLVDWGQSSREIRNIFGRVDAYLGVEGEVQGSEVGEVSGQAGGGGSGMAGANPSCPSCGYTVTSNDRFCQNCGARLQLS